jgi:uncharacterized protein YbjQ (UPF0145 family)
LNLFELFVKIGVDDQASSPLKSISSNLGKGLETAAKIGTKAIATAAAGITALTTAAVKNYADYEQLVGGVDTLFKDSSEKVQEYASKAYRTAGMSANAYMETVTSFSASLLQSLEGDTEAAAEKADMAIIDMADNANKMGTSIEMIQNAYQGFAKQNFTMLDNLKIGYGGTKTEMERLLADAEAISGIEYDISSYADIVDAIHVIQTEMGITGTTAKEASSTIQGSISAMSAAWSNLTVEIAKDNGDVEGSVAELVDSVSTAFDNIAPRVDVALGGISELISSALPKFAELITGAVTKYAPKLIESGVAVIGSMISGIQKNSPQLTKELAKAAKEAISGLIKLAPDVIELATDLFSGIVEELPDMVVMIVKELPKLMGMLGEGIIKAGGAVVEAIGELLDPRTWLLSDVRDQIEDVSDSFIPLTEAIGDCAADLSGLGSVLSESGKTLSELDDLIETTESNITDIIKREFDEQDGYRQEDLENIRNYIAALEGLQTEKLDVYRSQQTAELQKLSMNTEELSAEQIKQYVANAQALLEESNRISDEMYTQDLVRAENYYKSLGELNSAEHQKEMEAAKKRNDARLEENERYYEEAVAGLAGKDYGQEEILKELEAAYAAATKEIEYYESKATAAQFGTNPAAGVFIDSELAKAEEAYLAGFAELGLENFEKINKWLTSTALAVSAGGELDDGDVKTLTKLFELLKTAPNQSSEEYQLIFETLTGGLESIEGFGDIDTAEELVGAFGINMSDPRIASLLSNYNVLGQQMGNGIVTGLAQAIGSVFGGGLIAGSKNPITINQNIFLSSGTAAEAFNEALGEMENLWG